MTPADIDRVFGRSRLRMVTGDHVEVFREASAPGERRRYTKRFLATPDGDFREWTEREWRILARLVGHGIRPVPDVVQFDRGAADRPALVQTYDAGITVDHWATLLPLERDGALLCNVFEDCAHWWSLARHTLAALDAIHALQLVHLDLKADNVCIPIGPAGFEPFTDGQGGAAGPLHPLFEEIALIDFAFSLVSGERLKSALPIAAQPDYEYQSPRLLRALEAGRDGDLGPTRHLDWRCDFFSLAAMLWRHLPEPGESAGRAWTPARHLKARALVERLVEIHDFELPAVRPHAELIALADDTLRQPDLRRSLERGWTLATGAAAGSRVAPTPVTRVAPPVEPAGSMVTPLASPLASSMSTPLATTSSSPPDPAVPTPSSPPTDLPAPTPLSSTPATPLPELAMHLEQGEIDARVAMHAERDRQRARQWWWVAGAATTAAMVLAAPLLNGAWDHRRAEQALRGVTMARMDAATVAAVPAAEPGLRSSPSPSPTPSPSPSSSSAASVGSVVPDPVPVEPPRAPVDVAVATAVSPATESPSSEPPAIASTDEPSADARPTSKASAQDPAAGRSPDRSAARAPKRAEVAPPRSTAPAPAPVGRATPPAPTVRLASPVPARTPPAAAGRAAPAGVARATPSVVASTSPTSRQVALARARAGAEMQAEAAARRGTSPAPPAPPATPAPTYAPTAAPDRAPPPVRLAGGANGGQPASASSPPSPERATEATTAWAVSGQAPAAAARPTVTAATPPARAAVDEPRDAVAAPADHAARAESLMVGLVPRLAQRAERTVSRALFVAGRSDGVVGDAELVATAAGLGSTPAEVSAMAASPGEAQALHAAARAEFARRGATAQAVRLQAQAFGANPADPAGAGYLAHLLLRQRPAHPEAARQLALFSLLMQGGRRPAGRAEDWATLAIANALLGRDRDAQNAMLVSLAVAPNTERQCRAALDVYAAHGERLRRPVEALLRTASESMARPSALCAWPPYWIESASLREGPPLR